MQLLAAAGAIQPTDTPAAVEVPILSGDAARVYKFVLKSQHVGLWCN